MDKTSNDSNPPSRRDFLMEMTALVMLGKEHLNTSAHVTILAGQPPTSRASGDKKFVAIQIGARSFVDEGVESVLDTLQQKGGVNVLMPTVFTYGRGLAGRQVPGQPLPDHGVREYDEIHGGSYTKLHAEFVAKSVIKNVRAPELGDFDILTDVIPKAKARGMRTYCLFEEAYNPRLMPGFEKIAEVYMDGRVGGTTCLNNPYARDFLAALAQRSRRHDVGVGTAGTSQQHDRRALRAIFRQFPSLLLLSVLRQQSRRAGHRCRARARRLRSAQ
jgi:hypothetical protein